MRIKITIGNLVVFARFNESKTAKLIWDNLPIEAKAERWGYDIDYAGNSLQIKIRKPPVIASLDSVLSGLIIAVDAGHGGENHGAIGATGVLEKDMTISMARHVETILTSKGAQVVHDEHATIALPPGKYRITRQREYSPEAIRNVAD